MEPQVAWHGADLILDVHVQPRAAKNEVVGLHGHRLKIRISSPPIDGKANRHLTSFLAEVFGVAKRDVILLAGENSRDKRFKILSPKHLPKFIAGSKAMD